MRALLLSAPHELALVEVPDPGPPGLGQVRARVHRVGLCGTDIHSLHGRNPFVRYPLVMGHELGVEIESVGPGVDHLRPGDRCAVEPYTSSPGDRAYARGKTNCSASTGCLGVHSHGGMCDTLVLPSRHFHPAPGLSFEELALVETLAIGCHAVRRAGLLGDETTAVVGAGPIGLTVLQFLLLRGLPVTVIDLDPARLAACRRLFPTAATMALEPGASLASSWDGAHPHRPDVVFDATGHPGSMEDSIRLAAHGGTVVFVGICRQDIAFSDPDFHRRELSLLASRNALPADFQEVLAALLQRRIEVASWITHRCPAEDFPHTWSHWLHPSSGLLKGLLAFT